MPTSWYLTSDTYFSGYEFDEFSDFAISGFEELLSEHPQAEDIFINGVPSRAIIETSDKQDEMTILTRLNEIKTGDIVLRGSENWLIVERPENNKMHLKSKIKLCPSTLKWLNSVGEIKETPFTLESSPSSSYGLVEDRIMILSKERRSIWVQANADTKEIGMGKRFIFDGRVWQVAGYNGLTEGLLDLTLEEDQYNEATDNMGLRICNYKEPSTPSPTSLSILINGDTDMRIMQTKTWTFSLYDNGVPIPIQPMIATVTDLEGNPTSIVTIINQTTEQISVKANQVGQFIIHCQLDSDVTIQGTKQVRVKNII